MSSEAVATVAKSGLDSKRDIAKEYLGAKWLGHPSYRYDPRHSCVEDIYAYARQSYLLGVAFRAKADRESNPAYQRASRVREAIAH